MGKVMVKEAWFDSDWVESIGMPEKPVDAIKWLQRCLEEVPPEFHDSIVIEFGADTNDWNGTCFPTLEIYYQRPETDEEREERIRGDVKRAQDAAKAERAEYERLKAKFGAA